MNWISSVKIDSNLANQVFGAIWPKRFKKKCFDYNHFVIKSSQYCTKVKTPQTTHLDRHTLTRNFSNCPKWLIFGYFQEPQIPEWCQLQQFTITRQWYIKCLVQMEMLTNIRHLAVQKCNKWIPVPIVGVFNPYTLTHPPNPEGWTQVGINHHLLREWWGLLLRKQGGSYHPLWMPHHMGVK